MNKTRASASVFTLVACLVLWSALGSPRAHAQDVDGASGRVADAIHFDIPAQPLADALLAYSHMTELSVLVDSNVIGERTSAPLSGDYSPHEALEHLLAGTGLQVKFTRVDAAVIAMPPQEQAPSESLSAASASPGAQPRSAIAGVMAGGDYRAYAALVQARVTDALCESAQTRPGDYRLLVQVHIDGAGTIASSRVVGSTGIPERDAAIEHAIRSLVLDAAPPAGLRQPVTILLHPRGDGVASICTPPDGRG
jgi:hypothetical protein